VARRASASGVSNITIAFPHLLRDFSKNQRKGEFMKKIILALVCGLSMAITLSACNEKVQGTLHVLKDFSVHGISNGGGDFPPDSAVDIALAPGDYGMSFSFKNKTELNMTFKGKSPVTISVPKDSQFPQENGPISIDAQKMNQDFSLQGNVGTIVQNSPLKRDYEQCTYFDTETFCYTDNHGHTACSTREVTRYGNRDVEFYTKDGQTTTQIKFVSVKGEGTLAEFNSVKYFSDRIYNYIGSCR
jgi:hypothetical protein